VFVIPSFSKRSLEKLDACHPDLQRLFKEVVKHFDCTILCGHRGEGEQNEAYHSGRSKLKFPESKHNGMPSDAVDVAPYPIDWNDKERFYYFAGVAKGIATMMDIPLRWGGDWDSDTQVHDQTFFDLPHYELRK
jgi:peptidoglycan L-alanyl-D-glutamate endopeptidase CwlK